MRRGGSWRNTRTAPLCRARRTQERRTCSVFVSTASSTSRPSLRLQRDAEDGRGLFNAAARGAAFGAAAAEEDAEAELACFAMHVLMRRFSAIDNEL